MTLGEIKETMAAGPGGPGETLALARQAHQMAKDTEHVASIFDKLGLAPSGNDNRRVLATIRYLGS
jgi:hypothetical protein